MGFAFFIVYLVLSFVRPWELFPVLQSLPIIGVASAAAVGATLISLFLGGGPTARAPQAYLTLLFVLWILFSFVAATHWLGGASEVAAKIQPSLLIFFFAFLNVDSVARLRIAAATLALLALFLVGQCAVAYHFGYQSRVFLLLEGATESEATEAAAIDAPASDAPSGTLVRIRSVGPLADPNDLGQALVTIAPFVIALRRPGSRIRNTLLVWAPATAILYGVALTRSRGALVALLIVFFFSFRERLGRAPSLIIAGVFAIGLVALGFTGGRTMALDESSEGRIAAWYQGIQMFKSSPIWGVGYGNFREFNNLVAHNSFIHCLAETGFVGYFLWLWLIALTFAEASSLAGRAGEELAPWGRAVHLAFVAFLSGAFFLSRTYSLVLFLILGLGAALSDMARRGGKPAQTPTLLRWVPGILGLEIASILVVSLVVRGIG